MLEIGVAGRTKERKRRGSAVEDVADEPVTPIA
jgi:hypothetical protein